MRSIYPPFPPVWRSGEGNDEMKISNYWFPTNTQLHGRKTKKKACDSTFNSVTSYEHSRTGGWNTNIIVKISFTFTLTYHTLTSVLSYPILSYSTSIPPTNPTEIKRKSDPNPGYSPPPPGFPEHSPPLPNHRNHEPSRTKKSTPLQIRHHEHYYPACIIIIVPFSRFDFEWWWAR